MLINPLRLLTLPSLRARILEEKARVSSVLRVFTDFTKNFALPAMRIMHGCDIMYILYEDFESEVSKDMTTSRAYVERNEEDNMEQEVPLQAPPQAPISPIGENVTNEEVRSAFLMLAQVMKTLVSQEVVAPVNPIIGRAILRMRDFGRMNHRVFYGSKERDGPKEFIDEVSKARLVGRGLIEWEEFKSAFLDRFFPLEMRETLVLEFINLRQGDMSVEEYALRFNQLSRYVPILVSDPRSLSNFVSGLSDLVGNKFRMAMLDHDIIFFRLGIFALQIEKKKLGERLRERKRLGMEDENSSLKRFFGQGSSKFLPMSCGERVSNPKPQRGSNSESVLLKPTCKICGRKHYGRCLADMEGCYGCGGSGHKMRDCPVLAARVRERKKIRSDFLQARGEQECPPNVAPGVSCLFLFR
ncbi:hypothetical protein MTR67_051475 [Solanum verrucosum]|uniref:CCHC-type domain-containing protein n=1 Tax=Solanum verrucosum TaxID=315347 RepID=A0AAF0V3Z1_SOLVR|nr:hypothetical protein MTR67_051475 [Solanum verrucosum]